MSDVIKVVLPDKAKDFVALVRAVDSDNPKREDELSLQRYFVDHPDVADAMGNTMQMATAKLLAHSFSTPSSRSAIVAKLNSMRAGMGYERADAVERSLIEHVVLCWLRLSECELRYQVVMAGNPSIPYAKFWEGKLSANQRRYLRSVETLERVRRLKRPDSPTMAVLMQQTVSPV